MIPTPWHDPFNDENPLALQNNAGSRGKPLIQLPLLSSYCYRPRAVSTACVELVDPSPLVVKDGSNYIGGVVDPTPRKG